MNWLLLIRHLLILNLRNASLLKSWLFSLISFTAGKYDADEAWKDELIKDLKVCPQRLAFEKLLNDEFDNVDRRITVEDGTDGDVTLWGADDYIVIAGNVAPIVFVVPPEETNVGSDVIIRVPSFLEKERIENYCKRYLFAGVGIEIKYI